MRKVIPSSLLAAIVCAGMTAAAADKPALSFTAEQAKRGQTQYDSMCTGCHGGSLGGGPGGPSLVSASFRARWQLQSAEDLFTFIRTKMPPGGAGTLSNGDYADVVAYILKSNGAAAGKTALPAEAGQLTGLALANVLPAPPSPPDTHEAEGVAGYKAPSLDATTLQVQAQRTERMRALPPVTDAMLKRPPEGSWIVHRSSYDAHGVSPLSQIKRSNVASLTSAWSWSLPVGVNQIEPLVYDGIMFVGSGGKVQAFDAATGDLMWQFMGLDSGSKASRNLAISGDRIFAPIGGSVVALDMHTGKPVWEHQIVTEADRLRVGAGPLVVKDKVIVPITGCTAQYAGGCFIVALDAATGKEAWRFNTIARPGQPGGNSWNGAPVDHRFGGSVWTSGTYDPDLDLVYFGVGQTYVTGTLLTNATGAPGSNDGLYTDSTLALRPATGELVWYYQHVNREVWDLDWSFEQTLATLNIDGKPRRTVTTGGKIGVFDTLDAATGQYLFSFDAGVQNLVSAVDPKTGAKTISPELKPEPNVNKYVCPSSIGARNWMATSFDPATGKVYVPMNDTCMTFRWVPNSNPDVMDIMPPPALPKDSDGKLGRVMAFDLLTHKKVWEVRRRPFESSAVLATAGGIIFEGSRDRFFRASDDRNGKVLWETRLAGAPSSFPITYMVNGVQYVAVTTGGGNASDGMFVSLMPEVATPATGTTLWVFRLPEKR
jgi:alcohol dehydrogenase (cytochrome c)